MRPYRSRLRAERARATRSKIRAAAFDLFRAGGYPDTTMAAVAERAGVSVQTLYNTFGAKSALLKSVYDVLLVGDDEPVPLAERPAVRALYAQTDPRELLHGYARLGRELMDRVGMFALALAAGAAAGDPDLVAHLATTDAERLVGTEMVARRVAELGALRADLGIERARDALWTLTSAGVWEALTLRRGWSGEEYARWVGDAMCAAVLPAAWNVAR